MNRPRINVFANDVPWPRTNGYRLRLASQVTGLAGVGDVTLVALSRDERASATDKPDSIALHEYHIIPYPTRDGPVRQLARWLTSLRPRRLVGGEWSRAVPEVLRRIDTDCDLVWWSQTDAWVELADSIRAPAILDFDNIESERIAYRRSVRPAPTGRSGVGAAPERLRPLASQRLDAVDERRWRRLERVAEAKTDATVVCSRLDLDRAGGASTHVIPNGYEPPFERSEARAVDQDHPTLIFVGLLTYEPNADGLAWFVEEVLPLIRDRYPGIRVRVVGRIAGALACRIESPNVEVRGEVADLGPELRAADVAIVPLRIGGGTRLKIIEAFATGIPVVSTSVGAEGLGVSPGEQLLIADGATRFATACCDVIGDERVRKDLVSFGHAHFDRHFRWSAVCDQVADLATTILATNQGSDTA